MAANPSVDEIKAMLYQLPVEQLVALMAEVEDRVETMQMMKIAETGFQEWEDPEEDIYNDET